MEESVRLNEPWKLGLAETAEAGMIGEQKLRQGFTTRCSRGFPIIANRVKTQCEDSRIRITSYVTVVEYPAQQ
jgi:hypothetical protein